MHLGDKLFWKQLGLLNSKTFLLGWHHLMIIFHFKYLCHLKMSSVTFVLIARSQMRWIGLPLDTKFLLAPTNTLFYERKGAHKEARKNKTSNI